MDNVARRTKSLGFHHSIKHVFQSDVIFGCSHGNPTASSLRTYSSNVAAFLLEAQTSTPKCADVRWGETNNNNY